LKWVAKDSEMRGIEHLWERQMEDREALILGSVRKDLAVMGEGGKKKTEETGGYLHITKERMGSTNLKGKIELGTCPLLGGRGNTQYEVDENRSQTKRFAAREIGVSSRGESQGSHARP